MIWFVVRRLAVFLATLLVAAVLIFVMLRLPADPRGGSDGGLPGFIGGALTGNFGLSAAGPPAGPMVAGALGVTLPLVLLALLLALAIGGAIAWFSVRRRTSWVERVLVGVAELGVAVPSFWLGMLLALIFSLGLHLFPTGGFVPWGQNALGAIASLILPALALALPKGAALALRLRTVLIEIGDSGYVRAARLGGESEIAALREHGLRNGLLMLLRPLGIEISTLIAAALVVENVFYLPGLGQLIFNGVTSGDMAVARGGLLVVVLVIAIATLLLRLGEGLADPRIAAEAAP